MRVVSHCWYLDVFGYQIEHFVVGNYRLMGRQQHQPMVQPSPLSLQRLGVTASILMLNSVWNRANWLRAPLDLRIRLGTYGLNY